MKSRKPITERLWWTLWTKSPFKELSVSSSLSRFLPLFTGGAEVMLLVVTHRDDLRLPDSERVALFRRKTCLKYNYQHDRFEPNDEMNRQSIMWIRQFLHGFGLTTVFPTRSASRQSLVSIGSLGKKSVFGKCCSFNNAACWVVKAVHTFNSSSVKCLLSLWNAKQDDDDNNDDVEEEDEEDGKEDEEKEEEDLRSLPPKTWSWAPVTAHDSCW